MQGRQNTDSMRESRTRRLERQVKTFTRSRLPMAVSRMLSNKTPQMQPSRHVCR